MTGGARQWWLWTTAGLIIILGISPLVDYWLSNPDDQRLVDLDVYRTGGEMVLQGRAVYDFVTPAPQLLPFTYPPIAALLATPLAAMSWTTAQWVWTAGIFVALAVTVAFAFRETLAGERKPYAPWVFALLMLACTYLMPIRDQVRFGQVDILLVALCLADCAARRPWWPRGFLIGLATAVKLTPGVFLIYLLVTRQWRTFWMASLVTALLTLLPFVVIPEDATAFWFHALLDPERLGSNAATTNQSVRGMLIRLYLPSDLLTTAIWVAVIAVIGWYGFRFAREAHERGETIAAVALTGLMAVLLSPVAWIHHLAWVVVVLGALVGDARDATRVKVAVGVWLYYVLPIPWWGVTLKAAEIPVLSPVLGKIVQNAYGLGAIALVWILGTWLPKKRYSL
ncbi:glycosyltransferase 87 family protein [Nonomuraea sp. NPDC050310]|uniref:glycosyltransferase 87 family protein n=1 Tax=Nonomuraea sp. NPDC050310 TaxID=3154935 RepID=UPI0033CC6AC6